MAALFFVLFGTMQLGLAAFVTIEEGFFWGFGVLAAIGASGVIGGIGARRGDRTLARFAYVYSWIALLAFPIGTILGCLMLTGLATHLDAMDQLAAAE